MRECSRRRVLGGGHFEVFWGISNLFTAPGNCGVDIRARRRSEKGNISRELSDQASRNMGPELPE